MDTLSSRTEPSHAKPSYAEPRGPLPGAAPSPWPDALAALRTCGGLVVRAGDTPPRESYARVLAMTLAYLSVARGMLIVADREHEAGSGMSTRELARSGIDEHEAAALARARSASHDPKGRARGRARPAGMGDLPLPTMGTATPVLIAACEPANLDHQRRIRDELEVIAPGIAAAIAAALREERRVRDDAEAEHLKAELIGTVSHELRSPLAAVTGYASTLLRYEQRLSRHERQEFLRAILSAGERLVLLIDRMLAMSQLAAGEMPLQLAYSRPTRARGARRGGSA